MKKVLSLFVILLIFWELTLTNYCVAQQNAGPPLVMQEFFSPPPPNPRPPESGPFPSPTSTPLPGPPPPAPGAIPIINTISIKTLTTTLQKAITTSKELNRLLTPGKVWMMRAPAGEIEIKAGVLYQGVVVATLHFNPINGEVLPRGIHPHFYQTNIQLAIVKTNLSNIINRLKILPYADFREPEACWVFPVSLGNTIVAEIKVYYDGIHILPDYKENQEMMFYGE